MARSPNHSTSCDADAETQNFPTTEDQRSTGTNMGEELSSCLSSVLMVLKEKPEKVLRNLALKIVLI